MFSALEDKELKVVIDAIEEVKFGNNDVAIQ